MPAVSMPNLIADMFSGYIRIGTSRGRPAMAIYDPSAAVAFVTPQISSASAPAQVSTLSCRCLLTRGRTVVETRATAATFNAQFAADIDAGYGACHVRLRRFGQRGPQ